MTLAGQIFKYILFVLTGVVAVAIIFGAIMVIFPGAAPFGVCFSGGSRDPVVSTHMATDADFSAAETIEFKSSSYDINIRQKVDNDLMSIGDTNKFGIKVYRQFSGFVKSDLRMPKLDVTYDALNKILTYEILEPQGLVNKQNTTMEVVLPKDLFSVYGSKVFKVTTKTGNVRIGYAVSGALGNMSFGKMDLNTGRSVTHLYNVAVNGDLFITKNGGSVTVDQDLACFTKIEISEGLSKITLKNVGRGINAGLDINAKNAEVKVKKVTGDLVFNGWGGLLRIDEITWDATLDSHGTEVHLGIIGGTCVINGEDGLADITEVYGELMIVQKAGAVTVEKAKDIADINTTRGNITIREANANVVCKSERGDIKITCNPAKEFSITAQNKYGKTVIEKARGPVDAQIYDNGSGSIEAELLQVKGAHVFKTNTGNVTVKAPSAVFWLSWASARGNVDILLGGLDTDSLSGTYGVLEALNTSADNLSITTGNGAIKIIQIYP